MSEQGNPVRRIGIDQARRKLGPIVDDVAAGNGPIEITRRGKVLAVLGDLKAWHLHRRHTLRESIWRYQAAAAICADELYRIEQMEKAGP